MPWRIDFEGEVYREGDLTLDLCEKIAEAIGRPWPVHPLTGAKIAKQTLAALVADRKEITVEAALLLIGPVKADDFLNIVKNEEDDRPTEYVDGNPLVADELLTTT